MLHNHTASINVIYEFNNLLLENIEATIKISRGKNRIVVVSLKEKEGKFMGKINIKIASKLIYTKIIFIKILFNLIYEILLKEDKRNG